MKKVIIKNIKVSVQDRYADNTAVEIALRELKSRIGNAVKENLYINKKSVDTRHRNNLLYVYSITAKTDNLSESRICDSKFDDIEFVEDEIFPPLDMTVKKSKYEPIIIGFGPCGIFCAYLLSLYGYNPIVFERGEDTDTRTRKTEKLFSEGILDEESNVCYGEGGAGLFSDGKLVTRIKDSKIGFILKTLVEFGSPKEILYQAKPHVGTDNLKITVKNIRKRIIENGGRIYFNSKLTDIDKSLSDCVKIKINDKDEYKTDGLFLATGHSAEDIYMLMKRRGISMIPKPYSMGFRIEHKQEYINEMIYGRENLRYNLPQAEYTASYRENDRGVYTFCMCPGGVVVNSSAEQNRLVTNGMSYYNRDKENANSAVLVSFSPSDYGNTIDSAIEFRRKAEITGYNLGGGKFYAPVQTLGKYLGTSKTMISMSDVKPSYTGNIKETDLNDIFPKFINDMLHTGFKKFDGTLKGFMYEKAVLTAPETRTSAPVRILRSDITNTSPDCDFLYPTGEGSGYSGGITSSAADGINCVLKFMVR